MEKYYTIIQKLPLFSGIDEKNIPFVLSCLNAKLRSFKKNEFIFHAGDIPSQIGIVLVGFVQVIKEDFFGNRYILTQVGSGELFGEAFSFAQSSGLPVSVVASDTCDVLFFDYKSIFTTCTPGCVFHTQLIRNMLQILSSKNILLTQKVDHMSRRTTREKLISYLSYQSDEQKSTQFYIPFNRQELADYLAVDRSALSNELSKMRKEGLLSFERNFFSLSEKISSDE